MKQGSEREEKEDAKEGDRKNGQQEAIDFSHRVAIQNRPFWVFLC